MSGRAAARGISLRHISKRIGTHQILNEVSLALEPGEVHVLVGANGAGKSTLIRILSGADPEYQGEIWLRGARLTLTHPRAGQLAGIHVIYQELSLVGCLSAVDNWILAQPGAGFRPLDRACVRQHVLQQCELSGLRVDVDVPVERLPLAERQLLEIARALHGHAEILVFDEPTSALTETDATRLLERIAQLRAAGKVILYVSHRMEEIYRIADRISVLRDGNLVLTQPARAISRDELVQAMVGITESDRSAELAASQLAASQPVTTSNASAPQLQVEHLSLHGRPAIRDVSFEAFPHEIVGVCGLGGSGASELLEVLAAARSASSVDLRLAGVPVSLRDPKQALAAGIAYLPADRKLSVFSAMSLLDNGTLSTLGRYTRFGFVRNATRRREFERLASGLSLNRYSPEVAAGTLSGGNQQKLALLRCMATQPKLLLLAEPTRGVDVSATRAIHDTIRILAQAGPTIIVQSSELDELVALCDRVLVLYQGELFAMVERHELERQRLLSLMMGHTL